MQYLVTFEFQNGFADIGGETVQRWRDSVYIQATSTQHAIDVCRQFCNFTVMSQTEHFAWLDAGGPKRVLISSDE